MNSDRENHDRLAGIKPVSNLLFGGFLLFFIFEYLRPGDFIPFLKAAKIGTLLPVTVFVFTLFSGSGHLGIVNARNTKWLLLFLVLFPIQLFTADVTFYVYTKFMAIAGYVMIYFVLGRQVTSVERMKLVFLVLVFVHVLLVFLNPKVILDPETRNYLEASPFLGDGNDFAWSACIVIPFAIFLAQVAESKLMKLVYLGSLCLLTLAVVGTQSRGGSIALGASILYLLMKGRKKMLGLMAVGTLVVVVLLFAPQVYFDRMMTVQNYKADSSAQGRIKAWSSAIRMAVDHPLTGVGAGHFSVAFGKKYRPPGVGQTEMPWLNAHSMYFQALGEHGFTGIVFLLGLIITNMVRNERIVANASRSPQHSDAERKLAIAMQASFIAFAIGGVFLSGLYYPHIFVLAAMNESLWFLSGKEISKKEIASGEGYIP
jgi:putative inorganic carbon (HCO3(-)) transporter